MKIFHNYMKIISNEYLEFKINIKRWKKKEKLESAEKTLKNHKN